MSTNGDMLHEEHRELEDALDSGEHAEAIRIVHGAVLVVEAKVDRMIGRVEHACTGIDAARVDVANMRKAPAAAPAPAARSSAHDLSAPDAQTLQNQIEGLTIEMRGNFEGFAREHNAMRTAIGAEPNIAWGVKGSGILGALYELNNRKTVAIVAIGSSLAGGTLVAAVLGLIKFLGGH